MSANVDETSRPAAANYNPERFGKLESDVEYIKRDVAELKGAVTKLSDSMQAEFKAVRAEARTDFRWLLALLIALGGMMAKGFHWIG